MAIINLDTGERIEDIGQNEQQAIPAPTIQPSAKIIDLESGELIDPQIAPVIASTTEQGAAPETGIADIFTGSERIAATPELGTLPEFGNTPEGNTFKMALALLSTVQPKAQLEMIKDAIPDAEFKTTPDGSTIIKIQTEDGDFRESVLNRPGFSPQDLATSVAQVGAFLGPAKLANLGTSLFAKMGLGFLGGSATEAGLQEFGVQALGRETRDPVGIGVAGTLAGFGETIKPAIQGIRSGRQAKSLGVEREALGEVKPIIEQGQKVTEKTGIQLAPAQKTLDPFALEEQSFLGSLPVSARKAVRFLKTQNQQAQAAVKTFFSDLAPSDALQTGNVKARDAAKSVVQLTKDIRTQASRPFYKRAFKGAKDEKLVIDVDSTLGLLDKALAKTKAPSTANSGLTSMRKLIENSAKVGKTKSFGGEAIEPTGSNLAALHRAKVLLAEAIEKKGEKALDPTIKRDLSQAFSSLKKSMEDSSPAYKDAQRIFAQASGPVDDILASKIGQISKITDEKINAVSKQVFDEAITDPEVIKQTRAAIESVDPEAWASIVRVEAQRRIKNIDLGVENLTPDNAPGKIARALFGTGNKRSIFLASLTAEQRKNALMLEEGLKRAAQGRPGGSQTGVRSVISEKLKGVSLAIRRFIKNPVDRLISTGEEGAFNRNAKSLADSVFDPEWMPKLSAIRELDPSSPAKARAMTQLLNDINSKQEAQK